MATRDETHVWSMPITPAPELPENVVVISTAGQQLRDEATDTADIVAWVLDRRKAQRRKGER
jgi:hypothetical protein